MLKCQLLLLYQRIGTGYIEVKCRIRRTNLKSFVERYYGAEVIEVAKFFNSLFFMWVATQNRLPKSRCAAFAAIVAGVHFVTIPHIRRVRVAVVLQVKLLVTHQEKEQS